jgi:fatty-acyl-CoA synthase
LQTPPDNIWDQGHGVQKMLGNGLRKEVWKPFQERFALPYIGEFYGSTEGNATLINNRNQEGAVGYIPWIAEFFYPIKVVKFDPVTEEPVRNAAGHCEEVRYNEPGELLGKIVTGDALRAFDGYTNEQATNSKILRNVFRKGDCWFRTGDLFTKDKQGYMYVVYRNCYTFRWKGENVSTNEVASVLSTCPGIQEANESGVEVPGYDGRAGMACVVLFDDHNTSNTFHSVSPRAGPLTPPATCHSSGSGGNEPGSHPTVTLDGKGLLQHLKTQLSSFQIPLFLRIKPRMALTVTFKHTKVDLVRAGFDPAASSDPIFFKTSSGYEPLTPDIYLDIVQRRLRL